MTHFRIKWRKSWANC